MKRIFGIIIIMASFGLSACTTTALDDPEPSIAEPQNGATFRMQIRTGMTTTRTVLDPSDPTKVSWAEGDRIGMFVERSSDGYHIQDNRTLLVERLEEIGLFTGDMPIRHISSAKANFYAYYPASAAYDAENFVIKGEIPISQPEEFVGSYDYMIAAPIEDDYEESTDGSPFLCGGIISFPTEGQIFTTLKIDLPAMTAANFPHYDEYPAERITAVSLSTIPITARNVYLAGEFLLDVRSVNSYPVLTRYGGSKMVNVAYTAPKPAADTHSIYLTVLASGEIPAGLRVTVKTDNGQAEWTTREPIRFDRGTLCTLTMPDNWQAWTTPTNLSLYGTANCYVVKPNDTDFSFCCLFDATRRGNGVDYVNNSAHNGGLQYYPAAIDKSEIVDAVLVWESVASLDAALSRDVIYPTKAAADAGQVDAAKKVHYDPNTGYVHFTPGTEEGNAVIAIRDAEQNILWSWHIWVAADADRINFGAAITTEKRMMTRNMGAKNNNAGTGLTTHYENAGMHYQWGRKDPFVPLANGAGYYASIANGDGEYGWSSKVIGTGTDNLTADKFDGRSGSLVYATQHPNWLINSPNTTAPNDWYTNTQSVAVCNYLWGGGYHYRKVAGKVSSVVNEVSDTKTMFDPCPLGYRMPLVGVWGFQRYDGTTTSSNDAYKGYLQNSWYFNSTAGKGFFYSSDDGSTDRAGVTYVQSDGTTIFYPATGQIPGTNEGTKWVGAGTDCRYWTATVYGPEGAASGSEDCNFHACTMWGKQNLIQPANNYRRESLRPVRCQFEQFFHESYE